MWDDSLKIIRLIDQTIEKLKNTFPNASIIISTLIPRKDEKYNESIEEINNYIISLRLKTNNIFVMKNNKIYKGMLRDEKDLNQEGFFTFLANIKLVLFREIPVVSGKISTSWQKLSPK